MATSIKASGAQWVGRLRLSALWQTWMGRIALAVLAIGGGALAWFWPVVHGNAITAASVGARIACSCHFIEGRPLGDCHKDFEPGMGLVTTSADEATKTVTARVLVLSRQRASVKDGAGCVLEPWAG